MGWTERSIVRKVREAVCVVEQTYCNRRMSTHSGEEAKRRAIAVINAMLTNHERRWILKNPDKDWLSRKIEYKLWEVKHGNGNGA